MHSVSHADKLSEYSFIDKSKSQNLQGYCYDATSNLCVVTEDQNITRIEKDFIEFELND